MSLYLTQKSYFEVLSLYIENFSIGPFLTLFLKFDLVALKCQFVHSIHGTKKWRRIHERANFKISTGWTSSENLSNV